jgi:SNF2 family DNA or RNA helicase
MRVWVEKDKAVVQCTYDEKELVKAVGAYKFDKVTKTWRFPLKKLTKIIDSLNISYQSETRKIYDKLCEEKKEYHAKLNEASFIKRSKDLTDFRTVPDMSVLFHHQRQMVKLGELFGSYAFFAEAGVGKSVVAIRLMQLFHVPSIVIAPLSTLENVWEKEIRKWSNLRPVVLWNKLKRIEEDFDVYLINYEQFKKLARDEKLDKIFRSKVKCMIIDESQKCKHPDSQITKTILSYRDIIPHRFCLTGTPAPNDLLEYWGQMCFINEELLGSNYYQFRNTYFYSGGYGGYLYQPIKGAKEAIIDNLSKQAFSISKDDCLDLPPKTFQERGVYLEDIQQKAYDEMLKENLLEFEDNVTLAANELSKIMKLRQITSGFTINENGVPALISDTKVNVLKELLNEIPEEKQVIIWCNFHFEIERLKKELGADCVTYYGEMSPKEKTAAMSTWINKEARIFLGHPASGGVGLNLQQCSYMIWFSLSYSLETFSQACDRIYRSGQLNKCTYFILLGKRRDSELKKDRLIDEIIYEVLQGKQDLMSSCMEMLKK